jgi:hypothetical protein
MKAFRPSYATAVLLLLISSSSSSTVDEEDNLCPCKFDGSDASDCRVYGQLGDDVLIPWFLASQQCLDEHNIKISAIPSYTLEGMCNPPNANAFVNYLKFDSGSASASIKQSYSQFWDGDANPITLVPTINGVDCDSDASGCWNEVKAFFASNPSEIESNCQTFYNAARKDLELEQNTVRISICNSKMDTIEIGSGVCGDLHTQVEDMKMSYPEKACSAFGLGPVTGGSEKPPTCHDGEVGSTSGGYGNSTSSISSATISRVHFALRLFIFVGVWNLS